MAEQLAELNKTGENQLDKMFDTALTSGTWTNKVLFSNTNMGGIGILSFGAPNFLKRKDVTITGISGTDVYAYAYGDSPNGYINTPFTGDKLWGFCAAIGVAGQTRDVTVTYTVD